MTPAQYAETVIVPNVKRFLASRGDVGLAYTACIVTYHLTDHLAHAQGQSSKGEVIGNLAGFCDVALRIVQGLCNGTKHPDPRPGINPGDEQHVPQFAFGVPGAGFGQGRLGTPGLAVGDVEDNVFVDGSVQVTLLALQAFYPQHLGDVDLSFTDLVIQRSHAVAWHRG